MAEQQTAKPETPDEELERLKKMGEEIYERIRHKMAMFQQGRSLISPCSPVKGCQQQGRSPTQWRI